jgi:hypothetical protein
MLHGVTLQIVPFITVPKATVLSDRKATSAKTSRDCCGAQKLNKRNAVYHTVLTKQIFVSETNVLKIQLKCGSNPGPNLLVSPVRVLSVPSCTYLDSTITTPQLPPCYFLFMIHYTLP